MRRIHSSCSTPSCSGGVEQLVWMCLGVSLMSVCLTLPETVYNVVMDIANRSAASSPDAEFDVDFADRMMLFETVCRQAHHCCLSLKIFVYVASSSRFRRELRALCSSSESRDQRAEPSNSTAEHM